ncbi:vesicle-fusing ATPase-like [Artemia franciscana]|uniref:vesicle-fusing ATPase-like n=1 Tax=Artemia franciscana TaxID=6661 RepID=UPI0032DA017E
MDMIVVPPLYKDHAIKKYFLNAYESDVSCILFDDVGPTYKPYEMLKCYLKKKPEGKKLLVIGTTSTRLNQTLKLQETELKI